MEIKIANSAGFCFGVTRAVNTVYEAIASNDKDIYTFGPIIHNKEVVHDLETKGVRVIESLEEIPDHVDHAVIIIRSHGVSREVMDCLTNAGFQIIDATCPFVKKIHNIVAEYSEKGYHIVITGNPSHPEVIGIEGWMCTDRVTVVSTKEDVESLSFEPGTKVCMVSQTTFNLNKFKEFVEIVTEKGYDINVLNTICNATEERQQEARVLAASVDAMIVIGDKGSSNTQKLFEICKKECENTYYIQTSSEMDYSSMKSVSSVGITAGASTPNNIIEEVSKNVRKL
ncbi:MAG: 4-hydroxy-3-methylbut-2-enyl diphosphate reductase [Agathobacter sp.]|uniref:4-hydroxy-3-methylbut-2-enyl diphosphate reductase n=1 Tax=Agathobacter sp. TaxID=2021311 RepID=UPI00258EC3E9|nr:4-hydroxy-3-methylbut-2-enyl diphosphate reductase [Agathobacter sp.]MCR5677987.1 4-hydroxy-3-methylbut-2-enyl diphosphate reductase [Agathobacter sp.]